MNYESKLYNSENIINFFLIYSMKMFKKTMNYTFLRLFRFIIPFLTRIQLLMFSF
jgi:hypothetical protein